MHQDIRPTGLNMYTCMIPESWYFTEIKPYMHELAFMSSVNANYFSRKQACDSNCSYDHEPVFWNDRNILSLLLWYLQFVLLLHIYTW